MARCCCCCGNGNETNKSCAGLARPMENIMIRADDPANAVPLTNIIFDTGNFFNGDGKAHIQQDGTYIVTGQAYFLTESTRIGSRWAVIQKNGLEFISNNNAPPNSTTGGIASATSVIVQLKKGDYLELVPHISATVSASSTQADLYALETQLSIARLGD